MTSIIYDFPAIASALKGDDWYAPAAKPETVKACWREVVRIANIETTALPPAKLESIREMFEHMSITIAPPRFLLNPEDL